MPPQSPNLQSPISALHFRLGVPVKLLGAPLRPHDSRRWQNQPHLSVSLAYVRDILEYLHANQIRFYRLSGQLAPYLTHPDLPHFHRQIEECVTELAAIGDLARSYAIRLTMHPGFYIQLGRNDAATLARNRRELDMATALLDGMGLGTEAVIVIHVGGGYGDNSQSRDAFARHFDQLSPAARQRVVLENDDRLFSLQDALWLHRRTGIRIVFDVLHHRCLDPVGIPTLEALRLALATWPPDHLPKIHFSSPRTELRLTQRQGQFQIQAPLPNQHSDYLHPFEVIDLLRAAHAARLRPFDIMLEAKAKELALLRLREQIARFAPDLSRIVG
ncbi:MAG: UV DNA damage repair endonuclease UvsE [Caldilineaceae bacterium]